MRPVSLAGQAHHRERYPMPASLDFFYDVASPYSYLAAHRLSHMTPHDGLSIHWRPILLGGVFRATGNTMPAAVPARARYLLNDLERWAKRDDIPFVYSSSFPHNSLLAMRALSAAEPDQLINLSMRLFKAAWVDNQNISEPNVVRDALGSGSEKLLEATQDPVIKERLKATTQDAIDKGAFGAPAFVVEDALYWGNDRLEMAIEHAKSIG